MRAYTPDAASDQTLIDIDTSTIAAMLAESINTAAERGDRAEVNRLMRAILSTGAPVLIGRPNDHALMRAQSPA